MKLVIVVIAFFSSWICFSQISTNPDTVTYNTSGQLQGGGSYNVLSNDFRNICNSSTNVSTQGPLVLSTITFAGSQTSPNYFTISGTGLISVNIGTGLIPVGTYILNYIVCEGTGTSICQTQSLTIIVTNSFKTWKSSELSETARDNYTIHNNAQIIHFTDANLKAKLLEATDGNNIAFLSSNGNITRVDFNNDGEIDTDEALQIGRVQMPNANISNLEGMEYFTNLTALQAPLNNITSFNIMIPGLQILALWQNPLISLDISNLPNLTGIGLFNTQLASLNTSNNYLLNHVDVAGTNITSLDLGTNHDLVNLFCKNNPNLTSINIKNTTLLDYSSTFMQQDCWTNCPSLTSICADSNEIPALQSFLSGCGVSTAGIDINSDCALGVADFNNEVVALYPNPVKNSLQVSFANTISEKGTYAVYDVLGKKVLENTVAEGVDAITIPFENQANGVYLVKISVGDLVISKKVVKE